MATKSEVDRAVAIAEGRQLAASGIARLVRQSAGLSLRDVARVVGIDPGTVWHWEHGSKVPTGKNAIAYRDVIAALRNMQAPLQRDRRKRGAAVRARASGVPQKRDIAPGTPGTVGDLAQKRKSVRDARE
jgi:DNA-binding transcriptional regulator YiaG